MSPKVSFIMPTAKQPGKHFEDAVESVLDQSLRDIEFIFVLQNNPSEHAAYNYGSLDDRIIVANVNAPYGEHFPKAYNHGISIAESDVICFAHDDDIQLRDKAEILYHILKNRPDVGMVNAGWLIADEELVVQSMTWGVKDLTLAEYRKFGSFSPNAVAVRKSLFDKVRFNENYHRIHEFIWCLECMEAGIKFYSLRVPVFIQRLHPSFSRQHGVKDLEFAEYDRYRKERGDPKIAAGKQKYWTAELEKLRSNNIMV